MHGTLQHIDQVCAVILAGGEGRRLKPDKAFLRIGEETIIEKQLKSLKSIFDEVVVVTNNISPFESLGVTLLSDIIPGKGSIGGIYTALVRSPRPCCFIFACDMPFLHAGLIDYMIEQRGDFDVVIPRWGGHLEPLHAIYSRRCVEGIEKLIEMNSLSILDLFPEARLRFIEEEEIERFDPRRFCFTNINTEEDYRKVCRLLDGPHQP